jgi:glycosyltransferase involved in cell wall biosynthesis
VGQTPLSILHVDLSKDFGGSERYCLDIAQRQLAAGHKVGLVAWRAPAHRNAVQHHAPPGLAVYEAPPVFASWTVARAIRGMNTDIVNVHLPDSARAFAAVRGKKPPAVMTLHLRYRADEMKGMDGLICVAKWQAAESADWRGPKLVALNWPPSERPFEPAKVAAARAEIGGDADIFIVGSIARLNRIKRIDLLIDAFRRAALPNARLALIGDGKDREKLTARAGADPSIRFLGQRSDVQNWHRALDLFVLSSDWEGLPLGVLEAMRAATPILATACQGTAEVLEGSGATLVPPGDAAAMAAALRDLHARHMRGALPRQAYDLSRYDADSSVAQVGQFYRAVMAGRAGSATSPRGRRYSGD